MLNWSLRLVTVSYTHLDVYKRQDGLLRRRNHIAVFISGFGHTVQRQLILGVAAAGSRLAGLGPGKGVGQLVVGIERIGRIFCQLGGLRCV